MFARMHFRIFESRLTQEQKASGLNAPYELAKMPRSTTDLILPMSDVLEYTYTEREAPEVSELSIKFKDLPYLRQYVPQLGEREPENKNPIVIVCMDQEQALWFSFVTDRERYVSGEESNITFMGRDFTHFDNTHLVPGNAFGSTIGPATQHFRMKNRFDLIALEIYTRSWLTPLALTNGAGNTQLVQPARRFPGLQSYSASGVRRTARRSFASGQEDVGKVMQELLATFDLDQPAFRQTLVDEDTSGPLTTKTKRAWLQLRHQDVTRIDDEIIQRRAQIEETLISLNSTVNVIMGVGEGRTAYTESNVPAWDFATNEKMEDFSFIAGTNAEYLRAPTKTFLSREQVTQNETFVKINSREIFTLFNVSDIIRLAGVDYRIRQIQVSKTIDSDTVDIDIQEV